MIATCSLQPGSAGIVTMCEYKFLTLVVLNILSTTLLPKFYPDNLQHSSCKHVFSTRIENIVDPAGSTVFLRRIKPD